MGGQDARFMRHTKIIERFHSMPHRFPVRFAPHDNGHDRFRFRHGQIVGRLIRSRQRTHASGLPSVSLGARRFHSVKRQAQVKCPINTVLQRGVLCMPRAKPFKRLLRCRPNALG